MSEIGVSEKQFLAFYKRNLVHAIRFVPVTDENKLVWEVRVNVSEGKLAWVEIDPAIFQAADVPILTVRGIVRYWSSLDRAIQHFRENLQIMGSLKLEV